MNESIGFDPLLPWPQITVLTIAAIVLAAWLYRTGSRDGGVSSIGSRLLSVLRVAGIGALMILLLNPILTRASRRSGKPPLLILFDMSRSMKTRDLNGKSRFEVAKAETVLDHRLMARLGQQYDCQLYRLSDTASRLDSGSFESSGRPDGDSTKIGESIAAALGNASGAPSGAILVVSDGRNNGDIDPVETARQAKARHFPVFTMSFGTQNQGRDVSLFNRRPQVFAAPAQPVPISGEVRSVGYTGQAARVDLIQNGAVAQTQSLTLDDHRPVTASFTVQQPREGSYRYAISVHPSPGETILTNNKSSVFLQVLKSHARVLVLEARPSWDAKFLIQALHTDPTIDVDAIFKLSDSKTFAISSAEGKPGIPALQAPRTAADFAKYDVVVIGKGYEDFFDASTTNALKSFVADHAGNVIFLRGDPGNAPANLQALEPLSWSSDEIADVRMKVTDEGKRNPAFDFPVGSDPDIVIQKLPDLISATRVNGEKSLSVVLARATDVKIGANPQEMAVLAYQSYGQGRSLSLVGEGLWRWALLPPGMKDYGGCYNDFWTQLVRWLVNQSDFLPGQDVTLKTARTSYAPGQHVSLMAFVRGRNKGSLPPVRITLPSGRTGTVEMARGERGGADFVGTFKVSEPGEYLARMSRPGDEPLIVPFSVYPDQEEDLVTAADPEMMRMIAEAGGGSVLTNGDLGNLPQRLNEAQAASVLTTKPNPAWNRPPVLALILALFSIEWILRRRWGLL